MASTPFDEYFDVTGYENAGEWTENIGTGSVVDEDAALPSQSDIDGWGERCLKCEVTQAGQFAIAILTLSPAEATVYPGADVVCISEGLSNGQASNFFTVLESGGLVAMQLFWWQDDGTLGNTGGHNLLVYIDHDGDGTLELVATPVISTLVGVRFHFEFEWDSSGDTYNFWWNGSSLASGDLTGSATGWSIGDFLFGNSSGLYGNPAETRFDKIHIRASRFGQDRAVARRRMAA